VDAASKSGQRLVSFELDLEPAAQIFSFVDNFGNAVYHFDVPQPHDRLNIIARSAVETLPPTALPEALDMGEWDRLRSDFVRGECFDFLTPHGFASPSDALMAFVAERDLDKLRAAIR
jgi:transglutaminase-like putative cysteine protease